MRSCSRAPVAVASLSLSSISGYRLSFRVSGYIVITRVLRLRQSRSKFKFRRSSSPSPSPSPFRPLRYGTRTRISIIRSRARAESNCGRRVALLSTHRPSDRANRFRVPPAYRLPMQWFVANFHKYPLDSVSASSFSRAGRVVEAREQETRTRRRRVNVRRNRFGPIGDCYV